METVVEFWYQGLLGFSAMVYLVWILPGVLHKDAGTGDDRKLSNHPRLKTHP
jgi:hypothetical protein